MRFNKPLKLKNGKIVYPYSADGENIFCFDSVGSTVTITKSEISEKKLRVNIGVVDVAASVPIATEKFVKKEALLEGIKNNGGMSGILSEKSNLSVENIPKPIPLPAQQENEKIDTYIVSATIDGKQNIIKISEDFNRREFEKTLQKAFYIGKTEYCKIFIKGRARVSAALPEIFSNISDIKFLICGASKNIVLRNYISSIKIKTKTNGNSLLYIKSKTYEPIVNIAKGIKLTGKVNIVVFNRSMADNPLDEEYV